MTRTETIQGIYAGFGRGDVPAILELLDDDVDWGRTAEGVPYLRNGRGKDHAAWFFATLAAETEFHQFTPRVFAESGDTVLVAVDAEFTILSTGKRVVIDEVHEWRVPDGKVTYYRNHIDTALLASAHQP